MAQVATDTSTVQAAPAASCASGKACSPDSGDALQLSLPDGAAPCPSSGAGASCSDLVAGSTSSSIPSVEPSVPVSTIRPAAAHRRLTLAASARAVRIGESVELTAGIETPAGAVEIFDITTGALAGSCLQVTECAVTYSAGPGVHSFQAFAVATPSDFVPAQPIAMSDPVAVGWIGVSVDTTQSAIGPGTSTTLTATSTVAVEQFGYAIQLFDVTNPTPISFCSRGTSCSIAVVDPSSGTRSFVAAVGPVTSDQVSVTWLSVGLTGPTAYRVGDSIHLDASTNADLTNTPWSLGILDAHGQLVGSPCKTGTTCSADITVNSPTSLSFTAVVGSASPANVAGVADQLAQKVTGPASLTDIQAQSPVVEPARLLWGVDSCKAFTGDPTGEIYAGVAGGLGRPDFWGRYLTQTACPAISAAEVAMAHDLNMAILPIYNDYDCSNVAGYDTAIGYAAAAVAAARSLQIPQGRALAIDIEPPGPYCSGAVDEAFVRGWYDGVTSAGYVPIYYGNGTSGSEFASAYCAAQSDQGDISTGSYIWSFEPSLEDGGLSQANQPGWGPYATGCPDAVAAWQYQIDVNSSNPNVDSDEALSTLPLWYP